MNPNINDYNNIPNPPIGPNIDPDPLIENAITRAFDDNLYRDVDDVFDRKNSQRQFFTIPDNIPNDQEKFARWCYKFPETCKTDQSRCLRYEDVRFKYVTDL